VPPVDRYHRQTLLPEIGPGGQARLADARAAVVGVGALGTVVAEVLARAGVGTLTLIDRDTVEATNLQRQVLFDERDAAARAPKAEAAARRLAEINASIRVRPVVADAHPRTIERLLTADGPPGVVVDCTDNFQTRYLLNDVCVKLGLPLVYGGAVATGGVQLTVLPGTTPCLRCVFPDAPAPGSSPTCDTAGVLMSATGLIAMLQAAEAIKVLAGRPEAVVRALRSIDVWTGDSRSIALADPDPSCVCCGVRRFEYADGRHHSDEASLCGEDAVQLAAPDHHHDHARWLDLAGVAARLAPHGTFESSRHMLRGVLDHERAPDGRPIELTLFRDGRAIFRGLRDAGAARALYARYLGS
jgi:molybdopterin-synthase adenylyltransferase